MAKISKLSKPEDFQSFKKKDKTQKYNNQQRKKKKR